MPKSKKGGTATKYQRQSLELLKECYPRLSVRAIEKTFKQEHDFQFTPAYTALRDIWAVVPGDGDDDVRPRILQVAPFLQQVDLIVIKENRVTKKNARKQRLDPRLVEEMTLIPELNQDKENLVAIQQQRKGLPKEEEPDKEELAVGHDGKTLECGCCMEDLIKTQMVHCNASLLNERHYFCMTCLQNHVNEQLYGKNQAGNLTCMSMDGCTNIFAPSSVSSILSPRTKSNYDARLAQEAIKEAGIELRQCPNCGTHFDVDNSLADLDCPECKFKSCLKCQKPSHPGQTCVEAEQEQAKVNARGEAANAITTAIVRRCPNPTCRLPFLKEGNNQCNKMKCTSCGTISCYTCRKEIKDKNKPYKHFCRTPHCNHTTCGKCILFTDAETDDKILRRQVGAAQVQKAQAAGHDIGNLLSPERKATNRASRSVAAAIRPPPQPQQQQRQEDDEQGLRRRRQAARLEVAALRQRLGDIDQQRPQRRPEVEQRRHQENERRRRQEQAEQRRNPEDLEQRQGQELEQRRHQENERRRRQEQAEQRRNQEDVEQRQGQEQAIEQVIQQLGFLPRGEQAAEQQRQDDGQEEAGHQRRCTIM